MVSLPNFFVEFEVRLSIAEERFGTDVGKLDAVCRAGVQHYYCTIQIYNG